ncbi:tetratricopeptide repeat protein [Brumimicrobium glaciale]|uniref:Tetratricopeptide repeat protein n=1 Tax=Brumimicrobium glaciale TaxID=200475 RepID=A0A4Q4KV13_9FLAO|nr:tetratricopeptide repeat protein [Brumimicrobium glaciale]RYM35964.1 tetratricopeptide repeat protein [Brumimicrobium glaciale]
MMRSVLFITVTFCMTGFVTGQSWGDSLRIGKKYYQEKQFDKAYKTLLEAQKLAPSTIDLSQDIGNAAYRNEDFEMAEKAFRAAATKDNDESKNAQNWHNVGNSQMKAKNYPAAIESYKQSLRKNPTDERTRYNLAEAQRRLKIQEEQEQQQNQDQQSQDDQDNNNQQEKSDQQDKNNQSEGDENKNQQQKPTEQGGSPNENANSEPESKLSDRKTERILEDLLKQEMQTKKKVRGMESGKNQEQIKSGKRW